MRLVNDIMKLHWYLLIPWKQVVWTKSVAWDSRRSILPCILQNASGLIRIWGISRINLLTQPSAAQYLVLTTAISPWPKPVGVNYAWGRSKNACWLVHASRGSTPSGPSRARISRISPTHCSWSLIGAWGSLPTGAIVALNILASVVNRKDMLHTNRQFWTSEVRRSHRDPSLPLDFIQHWVKSSERLLGNTHL